MADKKKDWTHRRGGGQGGRGRGGAGAHSSGSRQEHGHAYRNNNTDNRTTNVHGHGRGGHSAQTSDKNKRPRYENSQQGSSQRGTSSNQNRHHHQKPSVTRANHTNDAPAVATLTPPATMTTQQEPAAVREIPGFYYDVEKKKYFKITANHTLGSQHPFSRQSIKERTTPKPVLDPIRKETGPRLPIASTHYRRLDWFLRDRQLGMTGNPRRQLCDMHAMLVRRWKRNKRIEPILAENGAKYTHLEIDPIHRDLYLGTHQRELWRYHFSENPLETKYQWLRLNGDSSELTSLHLTRDNSNIITTYLGDMGRSGTVHIQQGLVDTSWSTEPRSRTLFQYSPKNSSVWTSAVTEEMIALGADQKVVLLHDWKRSRQGFVNQRDHVQNLWTGSDVFSVAVEPQGGKQNLIYAGCRNGSVRIFDLSQPSTFTSGADPKENLPFMREKRARSILEGIGHRDSSVQSLRCVGEHYLITGAMNGEISMWDKRFVGGGGSGGHHQHSGNNTDSVAKSVLDFRAKVQDQFTKILFDINADETLLAAENLNQIVSLWSIKTGERLKDLEVNGSVSCLRFSPDHQGIWVAVRDRVQFWGLGG